ncbi:MAG: 50S ribosomal protein L20 [Planctomycetaceae bacterium]
MRVSSGKTRHKAKKRLMKAARGNYGGRSKLYRSAKETLLRAGVYAFRDRRVKKREFRSLWITRITAACKERGIRYSTFIHGLNLAGITLNRKSLSELAIHTPAVFDELVAIARDKTKHIPAKKASA